MLAAFVKETATAPGTNTTFNLGGASAPFLAFASVFSTGATVFYFMQDSSQAEWGYGTLTTGSPDTLARTTVTGNTSGTTSKLNFAGATAVYITVPPEHQLYLNTAGMPAKGANSAVFQGALVKLTSTQSIPDTTSTAVSWSAAEYDNASIWSGGSPTRLTVPTGVRWVRLQANVAFAIDAAGTGRRLVKIKKNGSDGFGLPIMHIWPNESFGARTDLNVCSAALQVTGGDYFEVFVEQGSGGSIGLVGTGTVENWASMELVG